MWNLQQPHTIMLSEELLWQPLRTNVSASKAKIISSVHQQKESQIEM